MRTLFVICMLFVFGCGGLERWGLGWRKSTQSYNTHVKPSNTIKQLANQFNDGMFEIGKDIQQGIYKNEGTTPRRCLYIWWMEDNTILHIVSARETVKPSVGVDISITFATHFESRNCGTWNKLDDLSINR